MPQPRVQRGGADPAGIPDLVVLIHGFGSSGQDWELLRGRLGVADEAVTLPGHAGTPYEARHTTIEGHARDIADLIYARGPAQC